MSCSRSSSACCKRSDFGSRHLFAAPEAPPLRRGAAGDGGRLEAPLRVPQAQAGADGPPHHAELGKLYERVAPSSSISPRASPRCPRGTGRRRWAREAVGEGRGHAVACRSAAGVAQEVGVPGFEAEARMPRCYCLGLPHLDLLIPAGYVKSIVWVKGIISLPVVSAGVRDLGQGFSELRVLLSTPGGEHRSSLGNGCVPRR
jgi:hypothetical protein